MKRMLVVVVLMMALSFILCADVYVKTNVHTDPVTVMGQSQPAKDEVTEMWLGNNKMANVSADKYVIMDMTKNLMWIINQKDKSYVETT